MGAGRLILQDHDRAVRAVALDPASGKTAALDSRRIGPHELDGWYALRQRRLLALYFHDDRIKFRCGRAVWDVHDATVSARNDGPIYRIRFTSPSAPDRTCRYLDWELARRWFIPRMFDPTPMAEAEDFNWSLFVSNLMSDPDRRARIGRIPPAGRRSHRA